MHWNRSAQLILSVILLAVQFALPVASRATSYVADGVASSATGTLLCAPDGSGWTLASRGLTVDVTVFITPGDPVAAYPFQDVTLSGLDPQVGVRICDGGSSADGNTDRNGQTTISGRLWAGGNSQGMRLYLAGQASTGPPLPPCVVSAS